MTVAPTASSDRAGAGRPRLLRPAAGRDVDRAAPPSRDLETVIDAPERWLRRRRAGARAADRQWVIRGFVWDPGHAGAPAAEPGHAGHAGERHHAGARGEGPRRGSPVVLLHGLAVGARMCAPTAHRLAPDGLVLAPDLPGSGRSSKPEPVPTIAELGAAVAAWLRSSGLPPAVLVGNSLGTQVALHATREAPEAVAGLVLASPTVDRRRRRWGKQIWRWQVEQSTQSLRLRAIQFADYARAGVTRAVKTFASALEDRPEDLLPRVSVPVLACLGGRDPLLTRQWVREITDAAPSGRYCFLPGAVHAMSHDNPLELARVVNGFIDELPG